VGVGVGMSVGVSVGADVGVGVGVAVSVAKSGSGVRLEGTSQANAAATSVKKAHRASFIRRITLLSPGKESLSTGVMAGRTIQRPIVSAQKFGERNRVFSEKPGFSSVKPQFIEKIRPILVQVL